MSAPPKPSQAPAFYNADRIGLRKGGCNPHPVAYSLADATIVIPVTELQAGVRFFGAR